jgi:hypothetical protein
MNIIKKYPDFKWEEYRKLNPYLYLIGLRTEEDYTNNFLNEGRYKGRIYKENQKKEYTFHVLLATIGKISILNILDLLSKQLNKNDYLTIVFDGNDKSKNIVVITNFCKSFICNVNIIIEPENLGFWGHGIRNKYKDLPGDFIYHVDDDDIIFDNTFDIIRKYCVDTERIYIFKIILENNKIVWRKPEIEINYISTQSGIIPNKFNKNGYWELKYGGDYNFYKSLSVIHDMIFIDKIIYKKK